MGLYGISWPVVLMYFMGGPGMVVITLLFTRSKWWKEKAEYYFSWNKSQDDDSKSK
ncbi:MAG: hypothetical protein Q4D04_03955 [Clostridia bacterium]|nr:hypothetical protein [Clostridia bacterium]